jgi:hypothetical protein
VSEVQEVKTFRRPPAKHSTAATAAVTSSGPKPGPRSPSSGRPVVRHHRTSACGGAQCARGLPWTAQRWRPWRVARSFPGACAPPTAQHPRRRAHRSSLAPHGLAGRHGRPPAAPGQSPQAPTQLGASHTHKRNTGNTSKRQAGTQMTSTRWQPHACMHAAGLGCPRGTGPRTTEGSWGRRFRAGVPSLGVVRGHAGWPRERHHLLGGNMKKAR